MHKIILFLFFVSTWNLFAGDCDLDTQVQTELQKPNSMDLREVLTPRVLAINNIDLHVTNPDLETPPPESIRSIYDLKQVNKRYEGNWTQIMYAAYIGDIQHVQELIAHKADLNLRNNKGLTALMLACISQHAGIVDLLLKSGADIHICDRKGKSAPIYALLARNNELLDLFFQTDPEIYNYKYPNTDINVHNIENILDLKSRKSDLRRLNGQNDYYFLKSFLQNDMLPPEIHEQFWWPIFRKGDLRLCILWTQYNKTPHVLADKYGQTPLIYAVLNNHAPLIQTLVKDYGYDIDQKDTFGYSAYDYSILFNREFFTQTDTDESRLEDINYNELLTCAIEGNAKPLVKAILHKTLPAQNEHFLLEHIELAIKTKNEAVLKVLIKHFMRHHCKVCLFNQENLFQQCKYAHRDYINFMLYHLVTDHERLKLVMKFIQKNQIKTVFVPRSNKERRWRVPLEVNYMEAYEWLSNAQMKSAELMKIGYHANGVGFTSSETDYIAIRYGLRYNQIHQLSECLQNKDSLHRLMYKAITLRKLIGQPVEGFFTNQESGSDLTLHMLCSLLHEIGHQVDYKATHKRKKFKCITDYSTKDIYEYHAEHFVAWLLNYEAFHKFDPDAAKYFDTLMQTALENAPEA